MSKVESESQRSGYHPEREEHRIFVDAFKRGASHHKSEVKKLIEERMSGALSTEIRNELEIILNKLDLS